MKRRSSITPTTAPTIASSSRQSATLAHRDDRRGVGERDDHSPPRVSAYLLLPSDPKEAAKERAKLAAFQRSLGIPLGLYEEFVDDRRCRPKRRRLIGRARRDGFDLVCLLRWCDLASTRARVAQIVLQLHVPVITVSGFKLDPADPMMLWVAEERTEHGRLISRTLDAKRKRGERVGQIPFGFKLAEDGLRLVPDPDEQRAMATARDLAANGTSRRQIAFALTEAGHRSRGGGPITHVQIGRWLEARPRRREP